MYVEAGTRVSLKQLVEERERHLQGGYYWGIKEFKLKEEDPAKFYRFGSRLISGCLSSRARARYVAASPASREMGELCFLMLSADGDPIAISPGLIAHVGVFGNIARWMIENDYETDPGFKEGDVFETNDPVIGACHAADGYMLVPVFAGDEIVAWSCSISHMIECGAGQKGSLPTASPNSFCDGFLYPPLKTGENFKHHAWWYHFWRRRTRLGVVNILDAKARLAGCVTLKDSLRGVIDEFGVEYFKQAIREIVEEGRRAVTGQIRTLTIPGRASGSGVMKIVNKGLTPGLSPEGDRDFINYYATAVNIDRDANMLLDHTGTSREGPNAYNIYPGAVRLGTFPGMLSKFAHMGLATGGAALAVQLKLEKGTCVNPNDPFAACGQTAGAPKLGSPREHGWNMMMMARGYLEECNPLDAPFSIDQGGGVLGDGTQWAFTNFEWIGATAQSAFAYKDGQPTVTTQVTPESDCGTAEDWEFFMPALFYLSRKLQPNICGHGKFRGGIANISIYVCLDPGQSCELSGSFNFGASTYEASGACGGYPAPGSFIILLSKTNIREIMSKGEAWPTDVFEIDEWIEQGKLKVGSKRVFGVNTPSLPLEDGDIWIKVCGSGSGYGDPIERDPALSAEDLRKGHISSDVVKTVYGVIAHPTGKDGTFQIDEAATLEERVLIKQQRRSMAVPAKEWYRQARARYKVQDYPPLVKQFYSENMTESRTPWLEGFWRTNGSNGA